MKAALIEPFIKLIRLLFLAEKNNRGLSAAAAENNVCVTAGR